jgi:N-methylhydantoinase B/oxoprolinase/acetone carboxylase alpha subunit
MKEEWLMPGAIVPVNLDTTKALVAEIKRLIDVVGGLVLKQGPDYERGFIDGMQKQAQSSVDKAVNAMSKREWVGLTDEEIDDLVKNTRWHELIKATEAKLKEKNT